jgi:hypothetical protein
MVNSINVLKQGPKLWAVLHIPTGEMNFRYERVRGTGGEVIHPSDRMPLTCQGVGESGTQKTGCSCD